MLHQNSVFHGLLKHVPWHRFDSLVDDHGADARVRRLSTKSQLVALLYGQLSGAASLREIVTGLSSHALRLYHVGAESGSTVDLLGCERATTCRRVHRSVGDDDEAGPPRAAPQACRDHLFDRCHQRALERTQRRLGAVLGRGLWRQSARDLRCRCRPSDLCRGQRGQGQRYHRGPADADRAGRHLCLRSRLLRLCLVGRARRRRLPDRHPLQVQHAARRGGGTGRSPRAATSSPTASASCPHAKPGAGAIQCRMRCAKCGS